MTSFEEVSRQLLAGINKHRVKSVVWPVFEAGHSSIKQGTNPSNYNEQCINFGSSCNTRLVHMKHFFFSFSVFVITVGLILYATHRNK